MTGRDEAIASFLAAHGRAGRAVVPLAGDASFRRYLRVAGGEMVMDAPPPLEDVRPFLAVAEHLRALGLRVPAVAAADVERGLVVLEDLGDETFERALDVGAPAARLYEAAVDVLVELHRAAAPAWLPAYDDEAFAEEHMLFVDWYLPAVTGRAVDAGLRDELAALWPPLLAEARRVPTVTVLRDYHTRNLMWLAGGTAPERVGLLDFQDAVAGPCSYDLASLVWDAYREVPAELAEALVGRYLAASPGVAEPAFRRSLAILGAQRALKVAGIFTRLAHRDGKPAYLAAVPRVLGRLDALLAPDELAPVRRWLARALPGGDRPVPPARAAAVAGISRTLRRP